jgi:hypothetical protein
VPDVNKLRTDQRTRTELGQAGLTEIQANLWPVDCQTCGKPLGGDPPSLVVHDLAGTAWAGLHHPACQSPRWDDGAGGVYVLHHGGATLSVRTCAVLLPEPKRFGRLTHWPVALGANS